MRNTFVLHEPASREALMRGVDTMCRLVRPTLGPTARTVVVGRRIGNDPPEVLNSGATITRRAAELSDRFEDMGAQLVRHVTRRVFERTGDGTATAAVLMQALMREATAFIAAGGSPWDLVRGFRSGLELVEATLRRQATTIDLPAEIAGIAAGIVGDPGLATMLGEIMDSVGPEGAVLIEESHRGGTVYEYVEGVRWNEGYVSHFLLRDGENTARLTNPRIFITDQPLETAGHLLPAVEACLTAGERSLFVIAPEIRESALALLILNREKGVLADAVAVRAPGLAAQRTRILEDLAVLTGGRFVQSNRRDSLARVTIEDLGQARQAWATRFAFGILGGHGRKSAIGQRIGEATAELRAARDDDYARDKIKERIGKLAGTAAVIRVGGARRGQRDELKSKIEAAVSAARLALRDGVVAGGGAAFVACIPALEGMRCSGDAAVGVAILARALPEPMRAIAENAGVEPEPVVHEALRLGPSWTFDALRRQWVSAASSRIIDPLPVVQETLRASVSAASMAITTGVLVRHKHPSITIEP